MTEYPRKAVGDVIGAALREQRKHRQPRRTRREAAAERLVEAIAVLIEEGVDASDQVALEDARAVVEQYLQQ